LRNAIWGQGALFNDRAAKGSNISADLPQILLPLQD